jgi:hypothetical protein
VTAPRPIGFWCAPDGRGKSDDLPDPRDCVNRDWSPAEREIVVRYLRAGRFHTAYMGYSNCRICGCRNGDREFTDGVWFWPEGYAHYLEAHGVAPPEEFVAHVLHGIRKTTEGRPR